ncbi:MAG: hypothetical protein QXS20_01680 [Candidatus Thorarchaeota archaeon]
MNFRDIIFLLKIDIRENFRLTGTGGKRSKEPSYGRLFSVLLPFLVAGTILYITVELGTLFGWPTISQVLRENIAAGSVLFNAVLIFSLVGSIAFSASSVANSRKVEYLLIMPFRIRTIFMEKLLLFVLYGSAIWLVGGTPIFLALSMLSGQAISYLSAVAFIVLVVCTVSIGSSLGGMVGLAVSKFLAGRRRLKQAGYFIATSAAIVLSTLWYYSIYFDDQGPTFFTLLIDLANSLGFSSTYSPGHVVSTISLGLLVGVLPGPYGMISGTVLVIAGTGLPYVNAVLSESAHYSGWLSVGSVRGSKRTGPVARHRWSPRIPFPVQLNPTVSVSVWYNLTNIRREGRILATYLLGPLRILIFLFIPVLASRPNGVLSLILPLVVASAMIPVASSYGMFFAGFETVYEGKNLMNLQLAATNLQDYVKGKVYSALPFSLVASVIVSILLVTVSPAWWIFALILPFLTISTTMVAGSVSANAAARSGNFKAGRMLTQQRGSAVRYPIGLFATLSAYAINYGIGILIMAVAAVAILTHPLLGFVVPLIYHLVCVLLTRHYTLAAGRRLAEREVTDYL